MAFIKVLDKEISELIAAGEVVERPSSVIKELVENSIDSGAKHITVEIKNGGLTYMRITDDGCGIAHEEVPTAFIRHATSKISEKSDLDRIFTLGFRGEALASVAAVSRVEMMTKPAGETYGTLYTIEGSNQVDYEKTGCPDGTTIIIRDLFYNVPARAKFMKKDVTEANAISNIVQKITLSRPDISFRFIRDNRTEFTSPGDGELYSAIYTVFGRDFARDLVPVEHEYEGVRVSGFLAKPIYARANRTFQNFFVNGRYVRSRLCSTALECGYGHMIMTGKFPACVLMIDMPPVEMDVNIHPAKAEVRFSSEKKVTDAIYFAVKNAFVQSGLLYELEIKPPVDYTKKEEPEEFKQQQFIFTPTDMIKQREEEQERQEKIIEEKVQQAETVLNSPEFREKTAKTVDETWLYMESHESGQSAPETTETESTTQAEIPTPREETPPSPENELKEKIEGFKYIDTGSFRKTETENAPVTDDCGEFAPEEKPEIRMIGEVFGLYIIVEYDGKMMMIDKHAAHERIIYERLKSRNCRQYSQALLTGIKLLLTAEEIDAIENNTELLEDMGFAFDLSQRPYITATAVPTFVMDTDIESIICEVADNLRRHKHDPQSGHLDDMLHTMACKAAVKANDKNAPEELISLAEQVIFNENIRHCPHGRPVMFSMTKGNIDHQFKRT